MHRIKKTDEDLKRLDFEIYIIILSLSLLTVDTLESRKLNFP